ncbi:hypothetical protein [Williamsia sp. CHRR-6]|uniref:hypothetical protein n=1 Tax=Williamsia sp. CHRR-6 TaxID=2835871 RepID=UPI001BDB0E50|nr:hypothetical protein [Williamsia sp. CHRR-6]MBT0566214.1 hypothetical protein [Williamsia sp. CHRR-6]
MRLLWKRSRAGDPDGRRRWASTTTMLSLLGLLIAGIGLAYSVHVGADRGDDSDATSAAQMKMLAPSPDGTPLPIGAQLPSTAPLAPSVVSRSKMILGTVETLTPTSLVLHVSDGRRHRIVLNGDTHYESADKQTKPAPAVGDLVVVHVLVAGDTMTADLVVDGRVTTPAPPVKSGSHP